VTEPGREHEDVVRRLRESGTARAPERLRGDVMAQVRAEPRRRRRRFTALGRPLVPYAAAACLLGAAVLALSHLHGNGAGSSSSAGGASAAGTPPEKSSDTNAPVASPATATAYQDVAVNAVSRLAGGDARVFGAATDALDRVTPMALRSLEPHRVVLVVPASQLAAYAARLRALEHTGHGSGLTVVLQPAP
jgi:hypothetical protein